MTTDYSQQQNMPEWYGSRLFHFTSSELHKLLVSPKNKNSEISKSAESYVFDKLAEELTNGTCLDYNEINTREVRWGHEHEPVARERYEWITGNKVEECGFFEYNEAFGGSPDGLSGEDGIIEIKCPYSSAVHARYLLLQTPEDLARLRPEYYAQIQGNLLATGRKWCDFISYDPRVQNERFSIKILRIYRDEPFIERAIAAIETATRYKEKIMENIVNNGRN